MYAVLSSSYLYYGCPTEVGKALVIQPMDVHQSGGQAWTGCSPGPLPVPSCPLHEVQSFSKGTSCCWCWNLELGLPAGSRPGPQRLAWGQFDHFRLCSNKRETSPQANNIVIKLYWTDYLIVIPALGLSGMGECRGGPAGCVAEHPLHFRGWGWGLSLCVLGRGVALGSPSSQWCWTHCSRMDTGQGERVQTWFSKSVARLLSPEKEIQGTPQFPAQSKRVIKEEANEVAYLIYLFSLPCFHICSSNPCPPCLSPAAIC